ncbi:hypothetical protein E4K10_26005 [Streptomyces sp. T1317-0309]|nr:hypothetical protein E4K10_26005 [Streptomyces sp. T1317-0309]
MKLPITVGVQTRTVYDFDDDVLARWRNNSTAATQFSADPDGLRIDFNAMRNVGIAAASSAQRVPVPGQPLRVRVRIKSSISVPSGLTYLGYVDAAGKSGGVYGTALTASSNWQYATFTLPASTASPISISGFQGINTDVAQQKAGTFVLDRIEADVPTSIDLPAQPDLRPDPLVSDDGSLPDGRGTWQFATLSDVQFTADNPALTQVATAAIQRIRTTRPDLIVLNGDITDRGLPQDLALARKVLTDAGCDLIGVGQEPAENSTPDPKAGSVPCYYVPGNHESYGLNNVQSDLTNFTEEFGKPYRTFDHKGTRFILLASSLGSLRGTAWDQLPMLQQALADAEKDRSVRNVMVFATTRWTTPATRSPAGSATATRPRSWSTCSRTSGTPRARAPRWSAPTPRSPTCTGSRVCRTWCCRRRARTLTARPTAAVSPDGSTGRSTPGGPRSSSGSRPTCAPSRSPSRSTPRTPSRSAGRSSSRAASCSRRECRRARARCRCGTRCRSTGAAPPTWRSAAGRRPSRRPATRARSRSSTRGPGR